MARAMRTTALCGVVAIAFTADAHGFPWSIDMYRGDAVQPLAVAPRVMPDEALPTHDGLPIPAAERLKDLKNPLEPTPLRLARAKALYASQCAVCHGAGGRGDGPAARMFRERAPVGELPSSARRLSDGELYAVIRRGGEAMPPLGDALTTEETWELVLYLRELAGRAEAEDASR
jgi:mono/diheme cytochrome c family protein